MVTLEFYKTDTVNHARCACSSRNRSAAQNRTVTQDRKRFRWVGRGSSHKLVESRIRLGDRGGEVGSGAAPCGSAREDNRRTVSRALCLRMLLHGLSCLGLRSVSASPARLRAATPLKKPLGEALPPGAGRWLALVVREYRLRKTHAQRRVVEVSAGGEPLAPLDELHAQDLLRLVVIGVGMQSVGFERRDARAIRPRDRFQCACTRPQLSPTRLGERTTGAALSCKRIGKTRTT